MISWPRAGWLGMLGLVVASAACWRTDIYAITGEPGGEPARDASADAITPASNQVTCPSPALQAGNTNVELQVGARSRSYVLHIPSSYDGNKPAPLIVDFHGIGSSGASERESSPYPEVTDPEGVVMAFPDGLRGTAGAGWNVGSCCVSADIDDLGFARALVADVQEAACIDPDRIYAVGLATGGGMAYHVACNAADVFAAVAPAAFDLLEEDVQDCDPNRPITVVSFRGTDDAKVPYLGGDSSLVPGMPITFLGAPKTFKKWAELDECTDTPYDDPASTCSTYSACQDGVEVVLCTKQGGRSEPGDASIAWPILKRHTLRP
jgi:polyhydroxybutyrate depolymerase